MKYIKTFESFVSEGKETFIEVSVRDAKKALEYLNDEYRGKFKTSASNKYSFKKEDDAYNALQDLEDIDIEVINTNIEESSAAVSENVDMEELQRELKALKAKHPKAKVTYSFVKDGKKGYVLHVKESDESIDEGKNRFRYDYAGWQQVYHAYNQTTHKTIEQDPMKFIDWLAKNTQPPQV